MFGVVQPGSEAREFWFPFQKHPIPSWREGKGLKGLNRAASSWAGFTGELQHDGPVAQKVQGAPVLVQGRLEGDKLHQERF